MLKKLLELQTKLKAPKGQYNNFGKYKYRSCEDIVEAVKPIASKIGLLLTISDEVVMIGDRFYIKATATISDIETGKEKSVTAYAREADEKKGMDESQITGATSSYARKYALNGLLAIDDNKDADTDEHQKEATTKGKKQEKTEAQPKTPPQEETIDKIKERTLLALINQKGASLGEILKFCEITSLSNMTVPQFMQVTATLEKRPDKGEAKNDLQEPTQ